MLLICAVILAFSPARQPPAISLNFLGYTNGRGPFALLAVTNRSKATITLNPNCQVDYALGPIPAVPEPNTRVASIEGNIFRVTRLRPQEGFVQEFFVFPGTATNRWRFEYFACYSSSWLEMRRSAEEWWHKNIRRSRWYGRSKTFNTYRTEWMPCPN